MMSRKDNSESGFTLIEVITVIIIFAVVSSIIMFNFRSFSNRVEFSNLVQDVALRVVQAQKSALNGVQNPNFLGQGTKPSYGVYFIPTTSQFTYFSDNNGNKVYSATGTCHNPPTFGNECISNTVMSGGEYVNKICYHYSGGHACVNTSSFGLSAVFTRPNPDASLLIENLSSHATSTASPACIGFYNPDEPTVNKTLMITSIGQVGVYPLPADSTVSPVSACNT